MLIAAAILATPFLMKGSLEMVGKEPFLLNRLSNEFLLHGRQAQDTLSYSGRTYTYPLGTVMVAAYLKAAGFSFIFLILPFLLGIFTAGIFYAIIKNLRQDKKIAFIATIILLLSPAFIYTFVFLKEFTIPIFLAIAACYLLIKKKVLPAYILLALMPFFGLEHFIIALAIIMLTRTPEHKTKATLAAIITLLLGIALYLPLLLQFGLPEITTFEQHNPLFKIFSDFGSRFGISIFIIFLAFFGLKDLWKEKYTHSRLYAALAIIILLTIIKASFIIYATFLLALLAALGILYLLNTRWESKTIQDLTIFILILGLLFSAASFLNNYKSAQPSPEIIESLQFLSQLSSPDDIILSHYTYGIWLNSISLRKNVMDEKTLFAPEINERFQDTEEIFQSRNLERTQTLLKKYQISYIYITPEMKQGMVWQSEEQGLLFVLKFSKDEFTRIYHQNGIEIWKVST